MEFGQNQSLKHHTEVSQSSSAKGRFGAVERLQTLELFTHVAEQLTSGGK